jgi:integrase
MPMQRSQILYYSAIKSEKTKENYSMHLDKFKEHFIIKDFDSLTRIKPQKIQEMIEDYILYLRNHGKSKSTIKNMISSLRLFFSMNDITCYWIKLKKMLPEQKKPRGDKPYSTEHVRQILRIFSKLPLFYAITHFISASGVRAGFCEELKIKHLSDMPNGCKAVKVYADSKDEYVTFIHSEVVEALEEYFDYRRRNGEKLTSDSWVFAKTTDTSKPLRTQDVTVKFSHSLSNKIDLGEIVGNRRDIMLVHGLRKRFNTILKSNPIINSNHAEKLMGHSVTFPLDDRYHKPAIEVLFEEYQKAIPDLMIDEKFKLKLELQNKNETISELSTKNKAIESERDRRIDGLEEKMKCMAELLKRVKSY